MPVMNEIISRRSIDGALKLGLRFPAGALKGAGTALTAAMGEEGRLVSGGASVPWHFESIVKDGEDVLLLGPDFLGPEDVGASLDESKDLEEGMRRLLSLARALSVLQGEGRLPRGIVSSGILFSACGNDPDAMATVLVLPPTAASKALMARGAPARAAAAARLSSPRAKGPEADASFLLAQAAYRFAAGKGAYEGEAGEPDSVASAARSSASAGLAAPRLDAPLAALVDKALADPGSVSLSDWNAVLGAARAALWTRELSPEEDAELSRRKAAFEAEGRSRQKRADFFRKRGGILIAAAVAVVVLALVAGDMLRAQWDKPDYSWLTPRELVQRYYLSVDALDLDSLEACGDRKAIKIDWNYVMSLVVLTKTRTAYEGKSPVLSAVDWIAAGKPDLAPTIFLYGIVGLSMKGGEAPAEGMRVSIRAQYSFWSLDRKEDPSGDPSKALSFPAEEKRIDELLLERGKKGYQIIALDRTIVP
jgi:hypothetical protein